jgi:hypothetical protein
VGVRNTPLCVPMNRPSAAATEPSPKTRDSPSRPSGNPSQKAPRNVLTAAHRRARCYELGVFSPRIGVRLVCVERVDVPLDNLLGLRHLAVPPWMSSECRYSQRGHPGASRFARMAGRGPLVAFMIRSARANSVCSVLRRQLRRTAARFPCGRELHDSRDARVSRPVQQSATKAAAQSPCATAQSAEPRLHLGDRAASQRHR